MIWLGIGVVFWTSLLVVAVVTRPEPELRGVSRIARHLGVNRSEALALLIKHPALGFKRNGRWCARLRDLDYYLSQQRLRKLPPRVSAVRP
jgi:hypothetical protein